MNTYLKTCDYTEKLPVKLPVKLPQTAINKIEKLAGGSTRTKPPEFNEVFIFDKSNISGETAKIVVPFCGVECLKRKMGEGCPVYENALDKRVSAENLVPLINEFKEVKRVVFGGGEPSIYYDYLFSAIESLKKSGKEVLVESKGYVTNNQERFLDSMEENGVDLLIKIVDVKRTKKKVDKGTFFSIADKYINGMVPFIKNALERDINVSVEISSEELEKRTPWEKVFFRSLPNLKIVDPVC